MPDCRYIILSHHSTETSKRGELCVLLLEYVEEDRSRQRKSYLLSDLTESVSNMLPSVREWIISVLTDISVAQFDPHLSTDEMFSWYSFLDVGPLRTTCSGSFACTSLSEAFASIKESVKFAAWSANEEEGFPDLLLPLDHMTLRSISALQKSHCQSKKLLTPGTFENEA
jgi:hypothetical protein